MNTDNKINSELYIEQLVTPTEKGTGLYRVNVFYDNRPVVPTKIVWQLSDQEDNIINYKSFSTTFMTNTNLIVLRDNDLIVRDGGPKGDITKLSVAVLFNDPTTVDPESESYDNIDDFLDEVVDIDEVINIEDVITFPLKIQINAELTFMIRKLTSAFPDLIGIESAQQKLDQFLDEIVDIDEIIDLDEIIGTP